MKKLLVPLTVAAAACAVAVFSVRPGEARPALTTEFNVPVLMRDAVVLRADVMRPETGGPFPTLVYRTPYGKTEAEVEYTTFRHAVERGYAVVIQDVRGRYASGGEFNAYFNEGLDGFDTIEWAAKQPWSNGAVGTFGLSYPGAVQWLAAVERPPHLRAMAPAMTFSTPQYFFYSGGTFDLSWPAWFLNNIAPDIREKKGLAGPRTYKEAKEAYEKDEARIVGFQPLLGLPDLRDIAPGYYEWLRHAPTDPWWGWAEIRGKYDGVKAAVLNLSGWYDEDYGPEGATTNFNGLVAARKGEADPHTALVLGPWVHGVDATGKTRSGEREFGGEAAIDYDELVLGWLDLQLKNDVTGWKQQKRVRYFLMGENAWHDADTWPPPSHAVPYFFSGAPEGGTRGALGPNRTRGAASSVFTSDPGNPFTDPYGDAYGGHDYRKLQRGGRDSVIFETAAFEADTDVAGRVAAEIYFSCDCPDADLWVRLYDVAPDGTAFNLMGPGLDVQRASLRGGGARQLLESGKAYRLSFANLPTANRFLAGHRLRVQISGEFFPHFSRNLHTGESEAASGAMKTATITILHDAAHPSRLLLPITNWTPVANPGVGGKPVPRRDIPQ
ncbi:MAG TPA: CocE/NonD family hydrolase [Candidatus Acidoferrales bacterium]|nr:CocE/NonD family hydrolase [Candidatus Acidoferrales bacterium]